MQLSNFIADFTNNLSQVLL